MHIWPNAYYNYKKNKKAQYRQDKQAARDRITEIYHAHNGTPGYRQVKIYLEKAGTVLSPLTVHKYMNTELGLYSITRKKKPEYQKGTPHKVFPNLINRDFTSDRINAKWCTDFTYIPVGNNKFRYNCTIIDLYDRSTVASITDDRITAELAKRTLDKALSSQPKIKGQLILHSDRGSQYTSKEFVEFCENKGVTQSMSKAGCPYDNAPMERYFNTMKCELIYPHEYRTDEELYKAIEEYAYITYNHVRPHSYNNYMTPFEARYHVS